MIDNVRICAKSISVLVEVSLHFLQLCKNFRITVNEEEKYTKEFIEKQGREDYVFLGENFLRGNKQVKNTEANLEKLKRAIEKMNTEPETLSYKNILSIIALIFFLCHTLFSPSSTFFSFAQFFPLLRFMSRISFLATKEGWNQKISFLNEARKREINHFADILLENKEVDTFPLSPPSLNHEDYFALVICDASASGWGAYIFFPHLQKTFCLKKLWNIKDKTTMKHSASAEPRALNCCISYIKNVFARNEPSNKNNKKIAVVTDHAAVAYGQRQWYSFYGGFSLSFFLNSFFLNAYSDGFCTEVFYVQGELNPADGPSRDPSNTFSLSVSPSSFCFPSLSNFYHPFLQARDKKEYMI